MNETNREIEADIAAGVAELCSRSWWVFLIGGIASVIFGVLAFTNPGIALLVLATFFCLLIAAMLEASVLEDMLACALGLGMFVLMEVFDEHDLDYCLPALNTAAANEDAQILLGVNCRDLRDLQVDLDRFARLSPLLPENFPCVAESGIHTAEQAADVARSGYSLALVGTAVMRSADPAAMLRELIIAGRTACA